MIVNSPQFDAKSLSPSQVIMYNRNKNGWVTGILMSATEFSLKVMSYSEEDDDICVRSIRLEDVLVGLVEIVNPHELTDEEVAKVGKNPMTCPQAYLHKDK